MPSSSDARIACKTGESSVTEDLRATKKAAKRDALRQRQSPTRVTEASSRATKRKTMTFDDARQSSRKKDQIRQSTRREMRGVLEKRFHDKMSRYTHSRDKRQHANDKQSAATIQYKLRRARIIVYGTIIIVPKRILALTARHLRCKTTRILNPVTYKEQNPSIRTTSASVI